MSLTEKWHNYWILFPQNLKERKWSFSFAINISLLSALLRYQTVRLTVFLRVFKASSLLKINQSFSIRGIVSYNNHINPQIQWCKILGICATSQAIFFSCDFFFFFFFFVSGGPISVQNLFCYCWVHQHSLHSWRSRYFCVAVDLVYSKSHSWRTGSFFFFVIGWNKIHGFLLNFVATFLFTCVLLKLLWIHPSKSPLHAGGCYECTKSSTCQRIYNIA